MGDVNEAVMPPTIRDLAHQMQLLWFVRWDRYVEGDEGVIAYGWIPRDDGKADFVTLEKRIDERTLRDGTYLGRFVTSSAEYSREIDRLLNGTDDGHIDCKRVEDALPITNVVRLKKAP